MSSLTAPRCRHIKASGTQCGSPALRNKNFCFYHQRNRPRLTDCYNKPEEYPTGVIALPVFEDAHSIQTVVRQVVQMVLQNCLERKTAGVVLYALQIASSNLKRMDLEKPQPEQVVIDIETEDDSVTPMAAAIENETASDSSPRSSEESSSRSPDRSLEGSSPRSDSDDKLPPGTIQACYQPRPRIHKRQTRLRAAAPS